MKLVWDILRGIADKKYVVAYFGVSRLRNTAFFSGTPNINSVIVIVLQHIQLEMCHKKNLDRRTEAL